MEDNKVSMFMAANSDYFMPAQVPLVQGRLKEMSEDQFLAVQSTSFKSPTTMLIISIFLGSLGIDRFMLGDTGMGILKLLTCGCCCILTVIDWINICNKTRQYNYNKFIMTA